MEAPKGGHFGLSCGQCAITMTSLSGSKPTASFSSFVSFRLAEPNLIFSCLCSGLNSCSAWIDILKSSCSCRSCSSDGQVGVVDLPSEGGEARVPRERGRWWTRHTREGRNNHRSSAKVIQTVTHVGLQQQSLTLVVSRLRTHG